MRVIRNCLVVSMLLFYDCVNAPGVLMSSSVLTPKKLDNFPNKTKLKANAFISNFLKTPSSRRSQPNQLYSDMYRGARLRTHAVKRSVITNFLKPRIGYFDNNEKDDKNFLSDPNTYLNAINGGLVGILLLKIRIWMYTNQPLNAIGYYLGYLKDKVILINKAISRIAFEKRYDKNNESNFDDTMKLFYAACDIKNTTDDSDEQLELKRKQFREYLLKYNIDEDLITNESLDYFANTVIASIDCIREIDPWFNTSIPLMKNMIYLDKYSDGHDMNKLKEIRVPNKNTSLYSLVENYLKETDPVKVEKNHLEVHHLVAPEIFSYVYEHFNLLIKLADYEINPEDLDEIWRFSYITYDYTQIFLSRIVEFEQNYVGGEVAEQGQALLDRMNTLADFINPDVPGRLPEKPKLPYNIMDYNTETPKEEMNKIKSYMSELINGATENVMQFFDKNIEKWKADRVLKPTDPESLNDDKESLLRLMKNNTDKAIVTMKAFSDYNSADFANTTTEKENLTNLISELSSNKPPI
ncbi:Hypothetical protein CINCED_3A009248 [Cinara cedri]|uniref:Uncharacterized protein n=1 Tax=Cinara cedri TaxID=506608 RepID=A0A5E4MJI5_9HEMI|nr:Hypothetical protein CINCED_3A009248 [Cinara cedri]